MVTLFYLESLDNLPKIVKLVLVDYSGIHCNFCPQVD